MVTLFASDYDLPALTGPGSELVYAASWFMREDWFLRRGCWIPRPYVYLIAGTDCRDVPVPSHASGYAHFEPGE